LTIRSKYAQRSPARFGNQVERWFASTMWCLYDINVEGVSLVSNYRTQFNKIIQTKGYSALVEKMKSKQTQFAGQDAQKREGK